MFWEFVTERSVSIVKVDLTRALNCGIIYLLSIFTGGKKMDFVMDCLSVNENGNLSIGGADVTELAKEYGTPLYIMDEENIRKNCRIYADAMKKYYDGNGLVLYASKAFSCKYMYKLAMEEGLGVDTVSGGEIYTALSAGFPAERIYFHGNNKTYDELDFAIKNNIGCIVIDNADEVDRIESIAGKYGKKVKAMFRVSPGVDAHTHDFIKTGQIDSKFGAAIETGEALALIKYTAKKKNIDIKGIHCHIGSQIFELEPFCEAAEIMLSFMKTIKDEAGIEISELNLGGGFGIKYTNQDNPVDFDKFIEAVSKVVKEKSVEKGLKCPYILMEPGRSIVASSGMTVYTVGTVKRIPNVRNYVCVDGGMGDNPRFILYGAEYDAVLPQRPTAQRTEKVTIAGKCCESGDVLIEDIMMPETEKGDLLAVLATGAYNYSMASNYNRNLVPPIVMVENGKHYMAVKPQTEEDLIRNDL